MVRTHIALSALLLLLAGCGRVGFDGLYGQVLTVTTVEDRLAGPPTAERPGDVGATGLSLREALTISNNTPGTELVRFAPSAFSPLAPGVIDAATPLPATGAGTVIDCADSVEIRGEPIIVSGTSDVTIEDCRFQGTVGDAIQIRDSSRVTIRNNEIADSGGIGISIQSDGTANPDGVSGTCSGLTITGNRILVGASDLVAIYDCSDVHIADNFMVIGDKGSQRGVHLERVTESVIEDNIIDPGSARLINLQDSSSNVIRHNILDGADAGVVLYGESMDNLIIQNVVMDVVYDGVYINAAALRNTVVHNTFFRCATAFVDGAPDTVSGNNLTSEDPADFIDPTPGPYDFTLVAGSPHIDMGEDLGFDCVPGSPENYLGGAPDLGAVESY